MGDKMPERIALILMMQRLGIWNLMMKNINQQNDV
jgi:hypothetical protein